MASPAATASSVPQAERVYTRIDLEHLLGGPHKLRHFEGSLAELLAELGPGQRLTLEFDRVGDRFAIHETRRKPVRL